MEVVYVKRKVVEKDDKLKNIANDNKVLPIDIIKILEL